MVLRQDDFVVVLSGGFLSGLPCQESINQFSRLIRSKMFEMEAKDSSNMPQANKCKSNSPTDIQYQEAVLP
eukprot:scaffold12007_cov42-Cyclotella_meneghiniana.AAC.10